MKRFFLLLLFLISAVAQSNQTVTYNTASKLVSPTNTAFYGLYFTNNGGMRVWNDPLARWEDYIPGQTDDQISTNAPVRVRDLNIPGLTLNVGGNVTTPLPALLTTNNGLPKTNGIATSLSITDYIFLRKVSGSNGVMALFNGGSWVDPSFPTIPVLIIRPFTDNVAGNVDIMPNFGGNNTTNTRSVALDILNSDIVGAPTTLDGRTWFHLSHDLDGSFTISGNKGLNATLGNILMANFGGEGMVGIGAFGISGGHGQPTRKFQVRPDSAALVNFGIQEANNGILLEAFNDALNTNGTGGLYMPLIMRFTNSLFDVAGTASRVTTMGNEYRIATENGGYRYAFSTNAGGILWSGLSDPSSVPLALFTQGSSFNVLNSFGNASHLTVSNSTFSTLSLTNTASATGIGSQLTVGGANMAAVPFVKLSTAHLSYSYDGTHTIASRVAFTLATNVIQAWDEGTAVVVDKAYNHSFAEINKKLRQKALQVTVDGDATSTVVVTNNQVSFTDVGNSLGVPSSAQLSMFSLTRGFLMPQMGTTARNAISAPWNGLQVFNTNTVRANIYLTNRLSWFEHVPAYPTTSMPSWILTNFVVGVPQTNNVTVTGVLPGDFVFPDPSSLPDGAAIITGHVYANDTVTLTATPTVNYASGQTNAFTIKVFVQ